MTASSGSYVDDDELGGVDGGGLRLCDDHGDGIADEAHLAVGERRPRARRVEDEEAVERLDAEIGRSEDTNHARGFAGLLGVDRHDPGVRVRRPHEHGAGEPLDPEIADESPVSEQELGVLEALNAVAQQRAWHLAKPTAPPPAGVQVLVVARRRHPSYLPEAL